MGQYDMVWTSVVPQNKKTDFVNLLPKVKGPFPNGVLDVYLRP